MKSFDEDIHQLSEKHQLESQNAVFLAFVRQCERTLDPINSLKKEIELFYQFPGSESLEAKKIRAWIFEMIAADIAVEEMVLLRVIAERIKKLEFDYEAQKEAEFLEAQHEYLLQQFLDIRDNTFIRVSELIKQTEQLIDRINETMTLLKKQMEDISVKLKQVTKEFNKDLENILNDSFGKYARQDDSRVIVVDKQRIEITFSEVVARLNLIKQLNNGEIAPHEFKQKMRGAIYECIKDKCQARNVNIDERHEDVAVIVGLIDRSIYNEMRKNKHFDAFHQTANVAVELQKEYQYRKNCLEALDMQRKQLESMLSLQKSRLQTNDQMNMQALPAISQQVNGAMVAHQVNVRCDKMVEGINTHAKALDLTMPQPADVANQAADHNTALAPGVFQERRRSIWRRS